MTKAVIFDMDGVIVDAEHLHYLAWKKLFLEKGIKLPESDFKKVLGFTNMVAARYFFKKYNIRGNALLWTLKKKKVFMKMLKEKVRLFPGAVPLIKKLSKTYKVGIATSAWRQELNIVMKASNLRPYISKIITKADIRNHKPHPQIYQRMSKKLKVDEKDCVVIEDSIPGVLAAKRAKCRCIAVTNSQPRNKLKKADLIVNSLKDKKVEKFINEL